MVKLIERPSPGTRNSEDGYRADIDGLRAVAVLSVLFFHAGFSGFQGGFTGVDVFFVISGFLIGGHVYDEERSGRFTFIAFYRRRAKRILPALYVVVSVVMVLGGLLLSPLELRSAANEGVATLLSGSNFFYWKTTNYFAVASNQRTLLMTWSLGVEEQFYLVVPLLMVFLLRVKVRLVPVLAVLSTLSFCIACYQVAHARAAAFYLLPGRGWELFGGVLLALITTSARRMAPLSKGAQNVLGGIGLLLVLLSIVWLPNALPFPGIGALPSVLGSAFLLCAPDGWSNRRILSIGILRYVGRISYSLYLWHWPLLTFTRIVLGTNPTRLQATAVLAVSFLAAAASYKWIEQPFRRTRTPGGRLLLRYAAVTTCLILVCLGVRTTFGMAFRAPELALEEKLDWPSGDPCVVHPPANRPNTSVQCFENTGRPALALWGDSHAGSLALALRQQAHTAGYDFIEASESSCPSLANTGLYYPESPDEAEDCIAFNNKVLDSFDADRNIQIVVLASYWTDPLVDPYEHDKAWIVTGAEPRGPKPGFEASERLLSASLQSTISALQSAGKRVLVFQDVPLFAEDPFWRIRTVNLSFRKSLANRLHPGQPTDPGAAVEMNPSEDVIARKIVEDAATSTGAGLFDLEAALLVSPATYRYRDTLHSFYWDNQHLTFAGAQTALTKLTLPTPRTE
jgi:peptidoglycan/LPS O-acetylase OafA/YrhL